MKPYLAALCCLTLLTACAQPPKPPIAPGQPHNSDAQALAANSWQLREAKTSGGQRIDALADKPGKPFTLTFEQGRVAIGNGCNHAGGRYQLRGETLRISELTTTLMACADRRLMDADAAIFQRLDGTSQAVIVPGTPQSLRLITSGKDVLIFDAMP